MSSGLCHSFTRRWITRSSPLQSQVQTGHHPAPEEALEVGTFCHRGWGGEGQALPRAQALCQWLGILGVFPVAQQRSAESCGRTLGASQGQGTKEWERKGSALKARSFS